WRIGLLGYYWNRRTAATADQPGSAMDPAAALETDIRALRGRTDRIVAIFHWGVPYVREPSPEDRAKARLAIDLGADVVVGHHPPKVLKGERATHLLHRLATISGSCGGLLSIDQGRGTLTLPHESQNSAVSEVRHA